MKVNDSSNISLPVKSVTVSEELNEIWILLEVNNKPWGNGNVDIHMSRSDAKKLMHAISNCFGSSTIFAPED